jgi:DNA-binding FadR family transcriptional regulator
MTLLGVLEVRPGQGAFVTSPDAAVLRDFFGLLLSMQPSLYDHVLEARVAVECQAVRLACSHAERADIERLESALARIQQTVSDENAGGEADFEFHNALVRAGHNEVLRFIHEAIEGLLRRSHLERRRAVREIPEFLETLGEAHRRIIDAIEARNPDEAELIVRSHFTIAQDYSARASKKAGVEKRNNVDD